MYFFFNLCPRKEYELLHPRSLHYFMIKVPTAEEIGKLLARKKRGVGMANTLKTLPKRSKRQQMVSHL